MQLIYNMLELKGLECKTITMSKTWFDAVLALNVLNVLIHEKSIIVSRKEIRPHLLKFFVQFSQLK